MSGWPWSPGPAKEPGAGMVQAVLSGARQELGRAGALAGGRGYPRVVIEVLRVDEVGTGPDGGRRPGQPDDRAPLARTTAVGVLGRAWVVQTAGGAPTQDTGDMRRVARFEPGPNAVSHGERRRRALIQAARALGRALARRVSGRPVARGQTL